jgi:FkbM family methyltransferase
MPEPVREALAAVDPPLRVVDLGANIGLFGVYIRRAFPGARVTAVEPHPANVEVLRRTVAANDEDEWRLVEACAAVRDGTVPFTIAEVTDSRIGERGDASIEVPAVDVFGLLGEVDLLKIDIEGGEWPILEDPRLAELRARVIALEYHGQYNPGPDAPTAARRLLEGAGYSVETVSGSVDCGLIWAWRETGAG